ncbi:MAG: ABC transporter ATP-binding protein [Microthrixaceae bacterium]
MSETVGGIRVIRAYGDVGGARRRLHQRIERQYRAQVRARFFFAIMFPISDLFSGLALAAVVGVGVWWGPGWGLQAGTLVACLFLTNLIVQPVAELGEVLDQTQTALAGWRKVLRLMDEPVEVAEPVDGDAVVLPTGALDVSVEGVEFAYEPGHPVLRGVSLDLPAGINAAIVGETGSGKSTMAKLLTRLADPTSGRVLLGGTDLPRRVEVVPCLGHQARATGRVPVRHDRRRERPHGTPRRHRRRGGRRVRPRSTSTGGSTRFPKGSRPRSASAATRCRWGSASSSPWHGPSSPTPAY